MTLTLSTAKEADSHRIAAIHIAAFGANALLRAQFPTPSARKALELRIAQKALDDIQDPKITALVIRDQSGEIISFAKWNLPVFKSETYVESPWTWPQETNYAYLGEWTEKIECATKKILGGVPCCHLSFLGTHPLHERRGAASLLIKWGIDRCTTDQVPALLESTVDAGPLYRRHGFKAVENVSMVLEPSSEDGTPTVYHETCFLYTPTTGGVKH